jgi:hypothetical protein
MEMSFLNGYDYQRMLGQPWDCPCYESDLEVLAPAQIVRPLIRTRKVYCKLNSKRAWAALCVSAVIQEGNAT